MIKLQDKLKLQTHGHTYISSREGANDTFIADVNHCGNPPGKRISSGKIGVQRRLRLYADQDLYHNQSINPKMMVAEAQD